jgi:SAM-dependent methyltransferase
LPFRAKSADFVFSLAVFEHLRQPFDAAREIKRVMKDGGYCYHECNFVFAYHGYPHHYFNASVQGMEQVFSDYALLRQGIAPYQMPSFALQMVLLTYLRHGRNESHAKLQDFRRKIQLLLDDELIDFDSYFDEQNAAYVAAGSYFFGMRQDFEKSTVIPRLLTDLWEANGKLSSLIPDWRNLGTAQNLLLWAKSEGRVAHPQIDDFLNGIEPFQKRPGVTLPRHIVGSFPVTEPRFGTLWDFPEAAPPRKPATRSWPGIPLNLRWVSRLREVLGMA